MKVQLRPLSRREVRSLDEKAANELALPTLLLMENAGHGAAAWLAELAGARASDMAGPTGSTLPPILILCGPGNNGGDGGVVARHLDGWGFPVRVVWFARHDDLRGDAAVQRGILARSGIEQSAWLDDHAGDADHALAIRPLLAAADWLVDGLLGTGLSRPVEGPLRAVIEAVNASGKPVLALDLPSGLDADTGQPLGVAVRAWATASFAAPKVGFSAPGASSYTGRVGVIDIGLPRMLVRPYLAGS